MHGANHDEVSAAPVSPGWARLEATTRTTTAEPAPSAAAPEHESNGAAPDVEDNRAVSREEEVVRLANAFDAQAGRREMLDEERKLVSHIRQLQVPGATLESAECRSSMCRLGVSVRDSRIDRSFFRALLNPAEPSEAGAVLDSMSGTISERNVGPDGVTHLVVYLSKDGA